MKNFFDLLRGAALGAGAMYLLDPQRGPERREKLRRAASDMVFDLCAEADRVAGQAGGALAEQVNRMSQAAVGSDFFTHIEQPPAGASEPDPTPPMSPGRLAAAAAGTAILAFGTLGRHPLAQLTRWVGLGLLADGMLHPPQAAPAQPRPVVEKGPDDEPSSSPARGQAEDPVHWKVAAP